VTVLRGALVIDGTGSARRPADVVVEGSQIVSVDDAGAATDGEVIDLDGLVLAPGFIDAHTHYDAQVLWDPDLTPSSWHGITTVVMGNCGFGIAPTGAAGRETIARTLENVEGMSVEALTAGIPWNFESFPEYLDAVAAGNPRLNVAAMLGHTPLRLYVMGPDAVERPATGAEVARMRALVLEALDAGAVGFASSRNPAHAGAWGKPVPSRLAEHSELETLCDALRQRNKGTIAITKGPDYEIPQLGRLAQATGRPVTWTSLTASLGSNPSALLDQVTASGGEVYPQMACRPIVFQVMLSDPAPFARTEAFAEVLSVPVEQRSQFYRDETWRVRARREMPQYWPGGDIWSRVSVQETIKHPELVDGSSLAVIAAQRGVDALDLLCDVALDDDLTTRFRVVMANDDEAGLAILLRDDRTLLALSDAGAHASQLCDAVFSTYLLEHWVRDRQTITLEKAIWRLTGHPASIFGLPGRGRIAPGFAADLVAFDPDTVAVGPTTRVWDLPAGADRLVAGANGYHKVWVNGVLINDDDSPTDVRPGRLIRNGGTTMQPTVVG
jgi:N-acyl-D-amino-acid deacylase